MALGGFLMMNLNGYGLLLLPHAVILMAIGLGLALLGTGLRYKLVHAVTDQAPKTFPLLRIAYGLGGLYFSFGTYQWAYGMFHERFLALEYPWSGLVILVFFAALFSYLSWRPSLVPALASKVGRRRGKR